MQRVSLLSSSAVISAWTLSPNSTCFDLSSVNELGHRHHCIRVCPPPLLLFWLLGFACSYQLSDNIQSLEGKKTEKGARKPVKGFVCLFVFSVGQQNSWSFTWFSPAYRKTTQGVKLIKDAYARNKLSQYRGAKICLSI